MLKEREKEGEKGREEEREREREKSHVYNNNNNNENDDDDNNNSCYYPYVSSICALMQLHFGQKRHYVILSISPMTIMLQSVKRSFIHSHILNMEMEKRRKRIVCSV